MTDEVCRQHRQPEQHGYWNERHADPQPRESAPGCDGIEPRQEMTHGWHSTEEFRGAFAEPLKRGKRKQRQRPDGDCGSPADKRPGG